MVPEKANSFLSEKELILTPIQMKPFFKYDKNKLAGEGNQHSDQ